jgi:hypothetical protein
MKNSTTRSIFSALWLLKLGIDFIKKFHPNGYFGASGSSYGSSIIRALMTEL